MPDTVTVEIPFDYLDLLAAKCGDTVAYVEEYKDEKEEPYHEVVLSKEEWLAEVSAYDLIRNYIEHLESYHRVHGWELCDLQVDLSNEKIRSREIEKEKQRLIDKVKRLEAFHKQPWWKRVIKAMLGDNI